MRGVSVTMHRNGWKSGDAARFRTPDPGCSFGCQPRFTLGWFGQDRAVMSAIRIRTCLRSWGIAEFDAGRRCDQRECGAAAAVRACLWRYREDGRAGRNSPRPVSHRYQSSGSRPRWVDRNAFPDGRFTRWWAVIGGGEPVGSGWSTVQRFNGSRPTGSSLGAGRNWAY